VIASTPPIVGHPQVHEDHVDVYPLRDRDRLGPVAGLADHVELRRRR
jgi:hypothetical protein